MAMDPKEILRRILVLSGLVVTFAVPMWMFPAFNSGALWLFTFCGAIEWWASVHRAGVSCTPWGSPWVWLTFVFWFCSTCVMIWQNREVVGHRVMTQCLFIVLVVGDSAQLLVGRYFGRHYVCPRLSPKKTLEGYVGGIVLTIGYGMAVHGWNFGELVLVCIAACVGDLFFSAVKRKLKVKDFSAMLSAHGGILDLIDSYMFSVNVLYWRNIIWSKPV
eukprot:gnl/MRDRNA2_/MRDRNA2_50554_c0_seq1.p1 gnl/MRDRNA2_/MRDRNA2_50554_c0~~gnl/MRDRNA2_/MRDRNA2_50554_c0_seq1.p1  ORF type:complete len:218 (-),score=22.39 gnl/MRDRNA2_/MRDRNA2_50554_c0_seq1:41-694(-)